MMFFCFGGVNRNLATHFLLLRMKILSDVLVLKFASAPSFLPAKDDGKNDI